MKKREILLLLVLTFALQSFSQTLNFSDPIAVTSGDFVSQRPRITLTNEGIPYVITPVSNGIYGFTFNGSSFDEPVMITPEGVNVSLAAGPELASRNGLIALSWRASDNKIYLSTSLDQGSTFSEPRLVIDENAYLPNVAISQSGAIYISYLVSTNNWTQIGQWIKRTEDNGLSFESVTLANETTPSMPCECCFASVAADEKVASVFRNNEDNIRNVYAAVSENQGLSFDNFTSVDVLDWNLNACPDSGPDGVLDGDQLYVTWLSGATGPKRVNTAQVNANTMEVLNSQMISDMPATVLQSYPSVAASGDTLGVVWRDNRNTFNNVFMVYSLDGGDSFSNTILVNDSIPFTKFDNPHITYADNTFHIVYWGESQDKVWYQTATLTNTNNADELEVNQFSIYPNPVASDLYIENTGPYVLRDSQGVILYEGKAKRLNVQKYPAGTYFLQSDKTVQKFIIE